MVFDFLHEQFLREKCEILCRIGVPLMNKYHHDLRHQKGETLDRLRWYVARATTANQETVVNILRAAFSSELPTAMRLTPRSLTCMSPADPRLSEEVNLMKLAHEFACNLASNYGWSQQMFHWTFSFAVAGLLSQLERT